MFLAYAGLADAKLEHRLVIGGYHLHHDRDHDEQRTR